MKYLWITVVTALVITSLVAVVMLQPTTTNNQQTNTDNAVVTADDSINDPSDKNDKDSDTVDTATITKSGRFEDYESDKLAESGYSESILFFYAPWCPECRAFEMAINDEGVPDGVQILSVDYDSSTDLKEKYGVTLQTTFVKVDQDGELISKWVGYAEDKSVEAILENT